jgi:hypothetical protein
MRNFFQKYKIFIILFIVALAVVILVNTVGKKATQETQSTSNTPTPNPNYYQQYDSSGYKLPSYSQPVTDAQGNINLDSEKVKGAIISKQKLVESKLPIYIKNFQTSVGIYTTLNVYTILEDSNYLIHIEIYGIDYQYEETDPTKNPYVTAFIESFNEIKKQLSQKGIDIKNIYFIMGGKKVIIETSDLWIKTFNLL